jgi:hypothetical protein
MARILKIHSGRTGFGASLWFAESTMESHGKIGVKFPILGVILLEKFAQEC